MGVPIGLSKLLVKLSVVAEFLEVLCIDVNIDGLPLTKSSCAQLWPILVRVININKCPVFPVGNFHLKISHLIVFNTCQNLLVNCPILS